MNNDNQCQQFVGGLRNFLNSQAGLTAPVQPTYTPQQPLFDPNYQVLSVQTLTVPMTQQQPLLGSGSQQFPFY
jgi:hypothetical protein